MCKHSFCATSIRRFHADYKLLVIVHCHVSWRPAGPGSPLGCVPASKIVEKLIKYWTRSRKCIVKVYMSESTLIRRLRFQLTMDGD